MHLRLISGLVVLATLVASLAIAENGIGQIKLGVPNANPKSGTQPTRIDPDFTLRLIATRDEPNLMRTPISYLIRVRPDRRQGSIMVAISCTRGTKMVRRSLM